VLLHNKPLNAVSAECGERVRWGATISWVAPPGLPIGEVRSNERWHWAFAQVCHTSEVWHTYRLTSDFFRHWQNRKSKPQTVDFQI